MIQLLINTDIFFFLYFVSLPWMKWNVEFTHANTENVDIKYFNFVKLQNLDYITLQVTQLSFFFSFLENKLV